MATVVSIKNPITGAVEQVDKLDHTAQQIDDAVALAPQLSNPNLMDNWHFANPVNQRGQTSYIGAGYGIDRWKSSNSNLAVNLTGDGIVLSSGSAAGYLAQYFDGGIPIEDSYTISALVEAITGTAYFQAVYSDGTYGKAMKLAAGCNAITVSAAKTISRVLFQVNAGASVTVKAAKLELGSQQTLAHQDADGNLVLNEIPDYGEQLARCQRYYQVIPANVMLSGIVTASNTVLSVTAFLSQTMRATPTVSISNFTGTIIGVSSAISAGSALTSVTVAAASPITSVRLSFNSNISLGSTWRPAALQLSSPILLSADL